MTRPTPRRTLLPAVLAALGGMPSASAASTVPHRVGPYELVEELGSGGMGRVFLGLQRDPVERLVAVKLLHHEDRDDAELRARFDLERRALARANHDHVGRLYEVGSTPDGEPWFAMEHVEGEPIDVWCDGARLDLDGRLQLFEQVCLAVQHLHDRGVQHRDLKPANVLVTSRDGEPVPKVVDLGLAAVQGLAPLGELALGTPTHMAPEQFTLPAHRVDARADVFALGVMLYQLTVGTLPFITRQEGDRVVLERRCPQPSERLAAADVDAAAVAMARACEPRQLRASLRGGLDQLAARAVAIDAEHRFATPRELAGAIRTWRQRGVIARLRERVASWLPG